MCQFYNTFCNEKWSTMSTVLTWSHYTELLSIKIERKLDYYLKLTINQHLGVRDLRERMKNREYERLPEKTRLKLINKEDNKVEDFIKNPIIIKNPNNIEVNKEKVLKTLILEDIEGFMKELGNSFCYIGSEYKIKIGNAYNYIDILLYNIRYKCYVVIELKVTKLKKEYIGQVEVYMNYIDNNIKTIDEDKTIGIIICKKDNKYIMGYCSDRRILSKEYELV